MTTLEGNKLIANFMEYNIIFDDGVHGVIGFNDETQPWYCDGLSCGLYEHSKSFHSSWDWLMPVVRKIVEYCTNENEEAFMSDQYSSILDTIPLAVIEDAWKVVVEFIEYYNTLK